MTRVTRSKFTAALLADCVGLGALLAISLFASLESRHVNVWIALWLSANVFVLGGLLVMLALWTLRSALHLAISK